MVETAPRERGQGSGTFARTALLLASGFGLWLVLQSLLGAGGIDIETLRGAAPLLIKGVSLTIAITFVSVMLGAMLAAFLTAGLMARGSWMRRASLFWCTAFRGTPLVAQLYLVYYGAGEIHASLEAMGLWWFFRDPLNCVFFTFTLNTAAYQARILHGALASLPKELSDAGRALGLPARIVMLKILLPQAMLSALRPLGNEITKMTKASAVASLVTVLDLLGTVKYLFSQTLDFGFYILAAVLYVFLVGAIRLILDLIEQRLSRHQGQAPAI